MPRPPAPPADSGVKPRPLPDLETAHYWRAAADHVLSLPQCDGCGTILFPPRPRCPGCLGEALTWTPLSGRGALHSWCVMHMRLIPGFEPPYVVAVVELEEQPGLRLTANLVEAPREALRVGMALEVVFEDRGAGLVLPQFRPAAAGTD